MEGTSRCSHHHLDGGQLGVGNLQHSVPLQRRLVQRALLIQHGSQRLSQGQVHSVCARRREECKTSEKEEGEGEGEEEEERDTSREWDKEGAAKVQRRTKKETMTTPWNLRCLLCHCCWHRCWRRQPRSPTTAASAAAAAAAAAVQGEPPTDLPSQSAPAWSPCCPCKYPPGEDRKRADETEGEGVLLCLK